MSFVLAALSAHLLLRAAVAVGFISALPSASFALAAKPVLEAAVSLALLALWRRRRPGTAAASAVLAGYAVLLYVHLTGPFGTKGWDALVKCAVPSFVAAGAAAALVRRAGWRPSLPGFIAASALLAAVLGAVRTPHSHTVLNELGLVCFRPGTVESQDYSDQSNKDGYPPATFRYNSLGYRDEEPAASPRRRILLVGDSYIWGDGIPSNEETLGALLRAELERAAPGRYAVMSAGYPGLGLYGYGRAVSALQPRFEPALVVVGYLGVSDHDPLDPQLFADRLPRSRLARNLVVGLRVARQITERNQLSGGRRWNAPENAERFARLAADLSRSASERGFRLLYLTYLDGAPPPPAPATTLALPAELRYPGHRNGYWYEKDFHPKPALNRELAKLLAAEILRKGGSV